MITSMMRNPVDDHLRFLGMAIQSEPRERLAMWNALEGQEQFVRVRLALLQSVPGHPAYDPEAAKAAMRELIPQSRKATVALLEARMAEVDQLGLCYRKNANLQQRLDAVTAIEQQLQDETLPR